MPSGTRTAAGALASIAGLLVIIWLIRGLVGFQQYSATILLASFSLAFLGRVLRTKTSEGPGRLVASFLWNLVAALFTITLAILILGWVASLQSSVFPTSISGQVPDLVIIAIAAGLGAYALQKSGLARKWAPTPFVVTEGSGPVMEGTKLAVKHDTVGMPIRREGRTIGCVLLGEVSTSFKTTMGMVSGSLTGPVTTVGIPFQGRTLAKEDLLKMTGKTPDQLAEDSVLRAEGLDVGRIRVRDGCMGDRWKI